MNNLTSDATLLAINIVTQLFAVGCLVSFYRYFALEHKRRVQGVIQHVMKNRSRSITNRNYINELEQKGEFESLRIYMKIITAIMIIAALWCIILQLFFMSRHYPEYSSNWIRSVAYVLILPIAAILLQFIFHRFIKPIILKINK